MSRLDEVIVKTNTNKRLRDDVDELVEFNLQNPTISYITLPDGTATVPGAQFLSNPSSGFSYFGGALRFLTSATTQVLFSDALNRVESNWPYLGPDGSEIIPTFSFIGDSATGWYRPGAKQIAISTGGVQTLLLNGNTIDVTDITIGKPTSATQDIGDGTNLRFAGTNADQTSNFTVISERIYEAITEKSELLLFKGDDVAGGVGPDRIRLRAAEHRFQVYTTGEDFASLQDNNDWMVIGQNNIQAAVPIVGTELRLSTQPLFCAEKNVAQSIADGGSKVTWTSTSVNRGFTSFTADVLTIATAGTYAISLSTTWGPGTTVGERNSWVNNNTNGENYAGNGDSTDQTLRTSNSWICELAVNDSLEVDVFKGGGGANVNLGGAAVFEIMRWNVSLLH